MDSKVTLQVQEVRCTYHTFTARYKGGEKSIEFQLHDHNIVITRVVSDFTHLEVVTAIAKGLSTAKSQSSIVTFAPVTAVNSPCRRNGHTITQDDHC
jgi:hypothetical protein